MVNPLQRSCHKNPEVTIIIPIKKLEYREAHLQTPQPVVGRIRTQAQAAENPKFWLTHG